MSFFERRVKFLTESTENSFLAILKLLREHVSFGNFSSDTILDYIKILDRNETKLNLLKCDTSFFKWPHQTQYQSIAGHIFFPIQIERCETGAILYEFIGVLLAASSRFSNTYSQIKLVEIFECYDVEKYDLDSYFQKFFPRDYDNFKKYTLDYVEGVPCLFGAFLSNYAGNHRLMTYYLAKGVEKRISQCIVNYGVYLKDKTHLLELLKGDRMNYIDLERTIEKDKSERLKLNIELGKLGNPDGYKTAALLESEDDKKLEYFNLAAEQGMLECYENMREIYLKRTNESKYIDCCVKAGERGDLNSYAILGEYLWHNKNQNQAINYFKNAGRRGHELLRDFGFEDDEKYAEIRFVMLKNMAKISFEPANPIYENPYIFNCPICNKICDVGDYSGTKDCELCDRNICLDCVAMTGCQTRDGIYMDCFEFKCDYCGGNAPLEFYLDENGCFCEKHRFKTDEYGYIDIKFI